MTDILQSLQDKAAIQETILTYGTAIDGRNRPLYRSIFADELYMDFESFRGMDRVAARDKS